MNEVQELVDKARKMCSPQTFYRLAKVTGISHTSLTRVMLHDGALSNRGAFRLARHMRLDPIFVVTMMETHRAADFKAKAEWRAERATVREKKN